MTRKLPIGFAAVALAAVSLIGSSAADAQRIASTSISRPSSVMQSRPVHSARPVNRRHRANAFTSGNFSGGGANGFGFGASSPMTLQQLLDPVPPPGFDYAYLSAIDSELAVKSFIDPVTQLRLAAAERVLRDTGGFGGSGFYLLGGGGYYLPDETDQPPQQQSQQPQIIVLQQAPANQEEAAQSEPEAEPEGALLPDVGQFTLVLRNGSQIQAVAFTRSNDRIIYITAEGNRRAIPISDLDSDATVRINEERGTPLSFPL